jgi:hypothetical protein
MSRRLIHRGGALPFSPDAVLFDGSNDYGDFAGSGTEFSDNNYITGSVWFYLNLEATSYPTFGSFHPALFNCPGNYMDLHCYNPSSGQVINMHNLGRPAAGEWHHLMWSYDGTGPTGYVYLDGASQSFTLGSGAIFWSRFNSSAMRVGHTGSGNNKFNGYLAEWWMTNEYIDLSVAANRAKFLNGNKPVDLGADGSTPTGTQALIYFAGVAAAFHNNKGSVAHDIAITGGLSDGDAVEPVELAA